MGVSSCCRIATGVTSECLRLFDVLKEDQHITLHLRHLSKRNKDDLLFPERRLLFLLFMNTLRTPSITEGQVEAAESSLEDSGQLRPPPPSKIGAELPMLLRHPQQHQVVVLSGLSSSATQPQSCQRVFLRPGAKVMFGKL